MRDSTYTSFRVVKMLLLYNTKRNNENNTSRYNLIFTKMIYIKSKRYIS